MTTLTEAPIIPVILNRAARRAQDRRVIQNLMELFRGARLETRMVFTRRADLEAASALRQGSRLVVAGGGDGTISAVASALVGTGATLGVLPLGTFNHFARDIGMPTDLESAVKVIGEGKMAQVDVGEVNGRTFINNSSVGLYPRLVLLREEEQRKGHAKFYAFVRAALQVLRRFPAMQIRLAAEQTDVVRSHAFVFVGNNEYTVEGLQIGKRTRLDAGTLFCSLAEARTRGELLKLIVDAVLGRLSQAPNFNVLQAPEIWVDSPRKSLRVALDGEVVTLRPPLHYRSRPGALRVIVP